MIADQWLLDGAGSRVRAYKAADVANALSVTAKTVINWAQRPPGSYPSLRGWAPRTTANPNRHWLVDADQVDLVLEERGGPHRHDAAAVQDLADQRQQLADERQLLEMERSVLHQDQVDAIKAENARLRDEVAELRAKVAAMGRVVFELTANA